MVNNEVKNKIIDFYTHMTPDSLENMGSVYSQKAFFKDPFNEIHSIEDIKKIFSHMFESLDNPRFVIKESVQEDSSLFVTWDFIFLIKDKEFLIHGSSFLKLDENDLIYYHRDYWDVGEEVLSKLPIVGRIYRYFCRKLKV